MYPNKKVTIAYNVSLGHRRYLPPDNLFRSLRKIFNSKAEWDGPSKTFSSQDILKLVDGINYKSGMHRGSKNLVNLDDCRL